MVKILFGAILAGVAFNLGAAAPSGEKKLSAREKAGIPLSHNVVPVKAKSFPKLKDMTPVGAPYYHYLAADLEEGESIGPVVDNHGIALNAANGIEYIIDVELSGTEYSLIIDTGSTDTWVVQEPFTCFNMSNRVIVDVETCRFGPYFEGEMAHGLIEGLTFNISYGFVGGPFLEGIMGYSDIKVAGLDLPKQQVALAQRGAWRGDEISSGILGLGLPTLTAALDKNSRPVFYDGVVTTMEKEGVPPLFALALSRNKSESFLSFGGVPDVETDDFASTPITKTGINYSRYTIELDALYIEGRLSGRSAEEPIPVPFLIDSGTTLNIFPPTFAEYINSAFDPPATWDRTESLYFVECDAQPPLISYEINGKNITNDLSSMILPDLQKGGKCASGVTTMGEDGLYILGDTFMQELVVVFDISDAMEIRIANRK